jgi:hypothetical protein
MSAYVVRPSLDTNASSPVDAYDTARAPPAAAVARRTTSSSSATTCGDVIRSARSRATSTIGGTWPPVPKCRAICRLAAKAGRPGASSDRESASPIELAAHPPATASPSQTQSTARRRPVARLVSRRIPRAPGPHAGGDRLRTSRPGGTCPGRSELSRAIHRPSTRDRRSCAGSWVLLAIFRAAGVQILETAAGAPHRCATIDMR